MPTQTPFSLAEPVRERLAPNKISSTGWLRFFGLCGDGLSS